MQTLQFIGVFGRIQQVIYTNHAKPYQNLLLSYTFLITKSGSNVYSERPLFKLGFLKTKKLTPSLFQQSKLQSSPKTVLLKVLAV